MYRQNREEVEAIKLKTLMTVQLITATDKWGIYWLSTVSTEPGSGYRLLSTIGEISSDRVDSINMGFPERSFPADFRAAIHPVPGDRSGTRGLGR